MAQAERLEMERNDPRHRIYPVSRWEGGLLSEALDWVAEEVPVALAYNRVSHVVMLATPDDLLDFALGFSLSEGILSHRDQLLDLDLVSGPDGIEVQMTIAPERFALLGRQRRNLAGRTGCGLCGAETLAQAVRRPAPVGPGVRISPAALQRAFGQLQDRQQLQRLTGAVHAAAWVDSAGRVLRVREDVGRHNALDKLIGTLARERLDPAEGMVLVTSRASYEMVQKAAGVGITLLAAVSAPTGLAVRLATDTGLTLVGFARDRRHVIYSHPHRIVPTPGT